MGKFKVFLSSPRDVLPERDRAQAVIERLNAELGGMFVLSRWEHSYYTASAPPQGQIADPGDHDIVICIFWKRIGTDLPRAYDRPDGSSRTGTEYEFEEAREARERRQDGLPDILVYRKTERVLFSEENVDEERAQKKALDHFWERWFRTDAGHFIAGFQTFSDTEDFGVQLERNLREWLRRRHSTQVTWDIASQGSPYRGLAAFDEDHAALFFGRKVDVARARARFMEAAIGRYRGSRCAPFLLILGPSGCGKSSFMRAGLVPHLRATGVPSFLEDGSDGIQSFRSVVVVPRELGTNAILGLATVLYRSSASVGEGCLGLPELAAGDSPTPEAFATLAASSPASGAASVLRALERASASTQSGDSRARADHVGLILAIDQLEELFASPATERKAFVRLLVELATSGRVWVTATMRNDFYNRLRQDTELSDLTDRGRIFDLGPPSLADFRSIIREPAAAAGLEFETTATRDLAAEIEREAAGEGSLPMIAFLLDELFQNRRGNLLTLETYDRLGGAAGALAAHGEQLFAMLPTAEQQAFPRVVRRLVRLSHQDQGPIANPASPTAFPPDSPERRLIGALSEARLLHMFSVTADQSSPAATAWVRWSHEALLRRWPRLRASVEADRRDYETLDRLQSAATLWQHTEADRKSSRLLTDLALAEGRDLVARWGTDIDEEIRQFVHTSQLAAYARRRRKVRLITATITALASLAAVSIIMGINALRQSHRATVAAMIGERTTQFMVSLFSLADPTESSATAAALKSVLDRSVRDIGDARALEPRVRAELRTAMGRAYTGLGRYSEAQHVLDDALRDQQLSGDSVPAESRVRTMMAQGSALYLNAEYQRAVEQLQQTVDLARASLPASSAIRSEALTSFADVLSQQGQNDAAVKLSEEALAADRKRGPEEHAVLAQTLDVLGRAYLASDRPNQAVEPMREALALRRAVFGAHHARTAESMNNLGVLYYELGRYDEAARLWSDALPIYKEVYGDLHVEVATILNNLGASALMAGRVAEAETLLRETLAMDDKLRPPTHDDLVPPLLCLAMLDLYNSRTAAAHAEIARAERIARMPDQGEMLDQVLLTAADVDLAEGHREEAGALLTESHGLLEKYHPLRPNNAWRYSVWTLVDAGLLAAEGNGAEARRLLAQAHDPIMQRFGENGFYSLVLRRRAGQVEQLARVPPARGEPQAGAARR